MAKEDDKTTSTGEAAAEEEYDDSDYSDDSESDLDEEDEEGLSPEQKAELDKQREERRRRREEEEEKKKAAAEVLEEDDLWNFPIDRENWTEEDLGEHWEDYWGDTNSVGWDPDLVSKASADKYRKLWKEGKPAPPGTPYYVPYRKFYPPIPDNHFDIQTPEDVVEELERMEEFLTWVSYVFKDGSSYEGTVWDDLAHGKGVYTTAFDYCRYEGDWAQNMMEGHGVLECDLPVTEPIPDSKEALKAKKEGKILKSDYMTPFDREWLKKDARYMFAKHSNSFTPFEERKAWSDLYGQLPEKGHYKYSGQWKHNRFHGCGVYEVNGRPIWGKFYFGKLLPDPEECTAQVSALHSSLADIAAAKARMFANKPDGMVREVRGPYSDPSHPYMYEEEDLWMAPGFINAYYEVPKEWKPYVEELDKEREMWLNSFTKAPFVTPMPPELEHWWSKDDEFILLGNTPSITREDNVENVQRATRKELQGEVLLHVPTGQIINWANDDEGHLRFFIQPLTDGGKVIPEAAIPIPLGFDEYIKEKDEGEKKVETKKNIFKKIKEAWDQSWEKYEEERKRRREELEKKWKQEDQAVEIRQKLRRAERNLAIQIEAEKIREKYRAKQDKDTTEEGTLYEEQAEEDEKPAPEETEKTSGEEVKEDHQDDDDDDDDKKPRSFGKVAMVSIDDQKDHGSIFPTAFASLSLGPKVVDQILRSRIGLLISGNSPIAPKANDVDPITPTAEKSGFLRMTNTIRFPAQALSRASICARRPVRSKRSIKHGRYANGRAVSDSNVHRIWSRPEYAFLSLAVPLKQ